MLNKNFLMIVSYVMFDGEAAASEAAASEAAASEAAASEAAAVASASDPPAKSFTQEEVNKFVAEEKRKNQVATQAAVKEAEALKQKTTLSLKDQEESSKRLQKLKDEMMTKEELSLRDKKELEKRHAEDNKVLTTDRDHWKNQYTNSTIQNDITKAAVENEAISPDQISAIIGPNTDLIQEVDSDGDKTDKYITQVKFDVIDDEGKTKTLTLPVSEAVKRMSEMDKYLNLFKGNNVSGLGLNNNNSKAGKMNIREVAKDTEAYRKGREDGTIE